MLFIGGIARWLKLNKELHDVKKKKQEKKDDKKKKCSWCGASVYYIGLQCIECSNPACRWYYERK